MIDQSRIQTLIRVCTSLLILAGITFIYRHIAVEVNSTTIALTFSLAILGIATAWGLFEAIVSSIIGMLCFNFFFLPPVGTFTIADPQNWVALFAFLVTAVVASQLSASVKKRALEAIRRQEEVERLYELSRDLMLLDNRMAIAEQVADRIVQVFDLPAVAVFDRTRDRVYRTDPTDQSISDAKLRDVSLQGTAHHDSSAKLSVFPLNLGGKALGSLAILGDVISETAAISIRAIFQDASVKISVKDCGPGIPKAEQHRIFDRYYRVRDRKERVPGTGMGLAIARNIVLAHGGEIWVNSTPGQGSEFFFTLPAVEKNERQEIS